MFCVQGVSGTKAYIATQGPLPHTVVDFLRMLWEYDIQVMAAGSQSICQSDGFVFV